jgi:hypothetical protein
VYFISVCYSLSVDTALDWFGAARGCDLRGCIDIHRDKSHEPPTGQVSSI